METIKQYKKCCYSYQKLLEELHKTSMKVRRYLDLFISHKSKENAKTITKRKDMDKHNSQILNSETKRATRTPTGG